MILILKSPIVMIPLKAPNLSSYHSPKPSPNLSHNPNNMVTSRRICAHRRIIIPNRYTDADRKRRRRKKNNITATLNSNHHIPLSCPKPDNQDDDGGGGVHFQAQSRVVPMPIIVAHDREPLLQQQDDCRPTTMLSSSSSSSATQQSSSKGVFVASLIALWYTSNIGVILLNKFLLSNYNFRFPIFLTMCHMTACALFSCISIVFFRWVPLQGIKSRSQVVKIATLSVVFCGSVVGGNVSLRYLPVSFNQAVGATTPFFTAVFAYFMTLKREAWVTYAALVPVIAGVVIASGGEPSFHLFGFMVCISATAARAFKSVLQGVLLSSDGEKLNSMNLLLYMAPIAVVVLFPATLIMEPHVFNLTLSLGREQKFLWPLLLLNSSAAYVANLSNFLVTKHTSALTLQVLGNAKGAVAVVISILLFRNPVTVMGIGGYAITVLGVIAYGQAKSKFK